jgi:hypothetical protein
VERMHGTWWRFVPPPGHDQSQARGMGDNGLPAPQRTDILDVCMVLADDSSQEPGVIISASVNACFNVFTGS